MPGTIDHAAPSVRQLAPPSQKSGSLTSLQLQKSLRDTVASQNDMPTMGECVAHLQLLEAFATVKDRLRQWAESSSQAPEDLWHLYSKMAVKRFEKWIVGNQTLAKEEIHVPPVDVLMVWHTFMLHPHSYAQLERQAHVLGLKGLHWSRIAQKYGETGAAQLNDCAPVSLSLRSMGLDVDLLDLLQSSVDPRDVNSTSESTEDDFVYKDAAGQVLFQYDLVAALDRQSGFWSKMARYSWNISPSATSTLLRAIDRYEKFFTLINMYPESTIVPTLDIDLVWHTHQLSPANYRAYSDKVTGGRFIDHNDELKEEKLSQSFANSRELFRKAFDEEYHLCLCWKCEASRTQRPTNLADLWEDVITSLRQEEKRRERSGLVLPLDLARPQCADCGQHPLTCCLQVASDGAVGCGSGCSGDCGNCGA